MLKLCQKLLQQSQVSSKPVRVGMGEEPEQLPAGTVLPSYPTSTSITTVYDKPGLTGLRTHPTFLRQSGPMAEVGPEAEQHWEALQLLSINLERRWEAIVMQALQWQNRLKKELGEQQVGAL